MNYWKKRTNSGRVIYDRPKNTTWTPNAMLRVVQGANEHAERADYADAYIEKYFYKINAAYEILSRTLYAAKANYLARVVWSGGWAKEKFGVSENAFVTEIQAAVQGILLELIQKAARIASVKMMQAFGVPEEFAEPFVNLVFQPMWDMIDGTLGVFIRGLK